MNDYAARLTRDFPVRRKAKEKADFRTFLMHELGELGYSPRLEQKDALGMAGNSITNVVAGDVERAKLVLAAHYDTPLREPLPPLIMPGRPLTFGLYQALTPVLALALSFLLSLAVTYPLNLPRLTLPLFLLLLVAGLLYLRFGKSETNNACDNTSGVAALLETAAALTPRYRGEVAFVFLDGGESGAGARAFKKNYPCTREKTVVVLSALAQGEEILLLPSMKNRWNESLLDALVTKFSDGEGKPCFLKTDGFVHFPSDGRTFPYNLTICACDKVQGFGRLIRPRRITAIDGENLRIVADGLCALIAAYDG